MKYEEIKPSLERKFKIKKIKYDDLSDGDFIFNYYEKTLLISFYIEVILKEDDETVEDIYLTLTISEDDCEYYESTYDASDLESFEELMEELFEKASELSKVIPKLRKKAKEIEDLCEEYYLNINDLLTLN